MPQDLDQSGQNYQWSKVYLGPSLGWQDVRVMPETIITTAGTHTLAPDAATVLVDCAGLVTINLPDAAAWMHQPGARPVPSLTRAITIKDFGGNALAFPITIQPFGGQAIDGTAGTVAINANYQVLSFWPLNDLTGWYVEEGAIGGTSGTDGSQIFVEPNQPSTSAPEGSIWIDVDSTDLDLYELTGGVWVDTGVNLKGPPGGTAAGANTEIQFNNFGSFAADGALVYDSARKVLGDQSGIFMSVANLEMDSNAGHRRTAHFRTYHQLPLTNSPNFSNAESLSVELYADSGDNIYAGGTNAKTTFIGTSTFVSAHAAGQRFASQNVLHAYGMGDSALYAGRLYFAGGNISGDEGIGYNLVQTLLQQINLNLATITALPTPATINTTTTQVITASKDAQTVTVASSAGVVAGQWIIVNQSIDTGSNNIEAVQVISVPTGASINAIFRTNQSSGATIKPAKVIEVDSSFQFGEQRLLINLSGASYSTGTAKGDNGQVTCTGVGTAWTDAIVGGDSDSVGAISFDGDTYTGVPFSSTGSNGPLRAWYQITDVLTNTSLQIHKYSVAGDAGYRGDAITQGPYIIRPAMRILRRVSNTLICEVSAATWSIGHSVECAITPWPDITCFQYHFGVWTPGGTYRAFMDIKNNGARTFESGLSIRSQMPGGGGADTIAFDTGIFLEAPVNTGIHIASVSNGVFSYALRLPHLNGGYNTTRIGWQGATCEIGVNVAKLGMKIVGTADASSGVLEFTAASLSSSGLAEMSFGSIVRITDCYISGGNFTGSLPNATVRGGGRYLELDENATMYLVYSDSTQWRPTGPRGRRLPGDDGNNTTTLATVNSLTRVLQAGRTYVFTVEMSFTCAAAGGIQVAMATSDTLTATSIIYDGWIIDSAANGIKGNAQATALGGVVASSTLTGTTGHVTVKGTITVNAGGTFIVQFAQNTASGTTTTIKRGASFIVLDLI